MDTFVNYVFVNYSLTIIFLGIPFIRFRQILHQINCSTSEYSMDEEPVYFMQSWFKFITNWCLKSVISPWKVFEQTLPQWCSVPTLIEIDPVVLEKKIFICLKLSMYFCCYPPLEMALHLNKLEPLSTKDALC